MLDSGASEAATVGSSGLKGEGERANEKMVGAAKNLVVVVEGGEETEASARQTVKEVDVEQHQQQRYGGRDVQVASMSGSHGVGAAALVSPSRRDDALREALLPGRDAEQVLAGQPAV